MSLMFYCLLGVTAEHAAGGTGNAEQDLGTGASLQCEGAAPPCHLPQQDPTGTVLGPPRLRGALGQGGRGWCCEAAVAGGGSGALTAAWGGRAAQDEPRASAGPSPGAHCEWISAPAPCPKPKPLGPKFLA